MANLKPTHSLTILGWMVTELKLTGYELLAYALVYQMTQAKAGQYTGGVPFLAAWLGCSGNTARKYLHKLEEKGLIKSFEGFHNGVPFRYYQVIDNQIPKIFEDTPKNLEGDTQKIEGGIPKNFEVNNKDKIENKIFIPPTPQQVAEFTRSRGWNDPEGFGYHYVSYMTIAGWIMANGKHVKNWKLNVISWEPNNKHKTFAKVNAPKSPYASIEQVKQSLR